MTFKKQKKQTHMKSIKLITILLVVAVLSSCNFDINLGQENGNGNVITEERNVTEDFDKVKGSTGLDVYLSEGSENKIVVEADENLMDIIETNISNGKLTIRAERNIGRSKSKKVYVTYKKLTSIEASSGADVIANSVVKSETLTLDSSSGADLEVEVFANDLYTETSSGADMEVSGKASTLYANASSGSDINAKKLLVSNCNAKASSGADITVNVKDKLNAKASSGGDIKYYGDPTAVTKKGSSSGSVKKL
jgi:hypothetical protein